jgi:hypothetical protein
VVFMAFVFLCHFILFGMNELEWMLLDSGWTWGVELPSKVELAELMLGG